MCNLNDICLAIMPCDNGGICILNSPPDNYTCNCTGTGFMGTNCSGKYMCVLYISTVHVHVCTVY